jgi:hypothetical protein
MFYFRFMSVTIGLETGGGNSMNEQRWAITSPPFISTTPFCLNLTFEPFSYFEVRLMCINRTEDFSEVLIFRTNTAYWKNQG